MRLYNVLKIIFIIVFIISNSLFAIEKIDLDESCDATKNCKLRDWYIANQFDPAFLTIDTIQLNDTWKKVEKFPIIGNKYFPSKQSLETYTIHTYFDISGDLLRSNKQLGIFFSRIGQVYTIYINGIEIASDGIVEGDRIIYDRFSKNQTWEVHSKVLKPQNNLLVIKIQGDPRIYMTGLYNSNNYYFGFYKEILDANRDLTGIVLCFMYLMIGSYHLLLYFKRRKEVYNLFFGLDSLGVFGYFIFRSSIPYDLGMDSFTALRLELTILFTLVPFFLFFIETLFFSKISKINLSYAVVSLILILGVIFSKSYIVSNYILKIWQLSALISVFFIIYVFIKAIRNGNKDSKRLFAGTLIFLLAAIIELVDSLFLKISIGFTHYAFFAFNVGIATVLANRFLTLYQTIEGLNENLENKILVIEDLNQNLEKKVEDRTKELQQTLNEVRFLKEKQDGDYFLTTLIVEPLISNLVQNSKVKVEFIIEQKKTFSFKNKEHEIGGDICIADTITLMDREYTVFINADAMGKSIQGAGGAIVLGVVFKSLISRVQMVKGNQNIYPERWLKNSYIELQSIFESFEGSMLISAVFGLIDNETGCLYYINAEHPWISIYRDEKAIFIENALSLHKIGTNLMSQSFSVKIYQLEDGDSIFIGSDGKDDVLLSYDSEGYRVINEEESRFLQKVDDAKGNLETLYDKLIEGVELTDDLSVLKIAYHNKILSEYRKLDSRIKTILEKAYEFEEKEDFTSAKFEYDSAYEVYPQNLAILKKRAAFYFKTKDYQKANLLFQECSELEPANSNLLFNIQVTAKAAGNLDMAINFGERIHIRDPYWIENLYELSDSYFKTGNTDRAIKILQYAEPLDSKNPKIKRLYDKLHATN